MQRITHMIFNDPDMKFHYDLDPAAADLLHPFIIDLITGSTHNATNFYEIPRRYQFSREKLDRIIRVLDNSIILIKNSGICVIHGYRRETFVCYYYRCSTTRVDSLLEVENIFYNQRGGDVRTFSRRGLSSLIDVSSKLKALLVSTTLDYFYYTVTTGKY